MTPSLSFIMSSEHRKKINYSQLTIRTTVEIFHAADIGVSEGIRQFMYIFFGSISVGFFIGLICAGVNIFF